VTITTTGPDNVATNVANTTTSTTPPKSSAVAPNNPFYSTTTLGSALLGSALSSQPEPAVTGGSSGQPYLLGTDEAQKNVWNQESLKNALGL
jgi:hypothetical protein